MKPILPSRALVLVLAGICLPLSEASAETGAAPPPDGNPDIPTVPAIVSSITEIRSTTASPGCLLQIHFLGDLAANARGILDLKVTKAADDRGHDLGPGSFEAHPIGMPESRKTVRFEIDDIPLP